MLNDKYILLASNSPRRKELLAGLNVKFEVVTLPDIDESYPDHLKGEEIALYIARKKAAAYKSMLNDSQIILTADTIVCLENEVFGKPVDAADATNMLRRLSGKTHQVITGVTLANKDKEVAFTSVTDVTFDILTEDEIQYYITNFKPFDKAGAYGIQEWIGFIGVKSINGSYFNVMGLPVQKLYQHLKEF
ncbi:MAG: Maf-like protein [Bacteroidales bacterium]